MNQHIYHKFYMKNYFNLERTILMKYGYIVTVKTTFKMLLPNITNFVV